MRFSRLTSRVTYFLGSRKFFIITVLLLVVQAAWIALSGRYPMAFDEDFHLGVIRLYAHHISPFWSQQPANADVYGAVYRDPSYLYHYLMSFPYRLLALFVHGQAAQVIALRFINIALFACGLPLYRRLLLKIGASKALVQTVLMLFVLLPIVPLLAGQVNYDNLLWPLTALVLLLALRWNEILILDKRFSFKYFAAVATMALLASLVKYSFLPILVALSVFVVIQCYRHLGKRKKFWRSVAIGWGAATKAQQWLLVGVVIVSAGLFVERYGVNLADYHKPVPACDQVLDVRRCSTYGPWSRDYNFAQLKSDRADGPVLYAGDWVYGMWLRTFFAVDGPATQFETRGPLWLPAVSAIAFAGIGLMLLAWGARAIMRRYNKAALLLFGLTVIFYASALWLDNYAAYVRTGQPVAINGRYLLPLYPMVMLLLALGYRETLKKYYDRLLPAIAVLAIICFAWGGGVLTYVLRSRDAWLWPSPVVRHVDYDVRRWLQPVVPGASQPTEFLP